MKHIMLLASLASALGLPVIAADLSSPVVYSPNAIKVMGTLDSGQTSPQVQYSRPGLYRAFVFEGNGKDYVDITVTGANGKAFVALADSTLTPIASGIGHLTVSLPYHGPDIEAFYVLVKPTSNGPSRFAVHLTKIPSTPKPADATR